MAEITVTPAPGGSQQDLLASALGVKFQPFDPRLANTGTAPATQVLRGTAVEGTAGALITGVKMRNAVAAAGTLPTTARFGVADSTGKILALSANLNALANWVTGVLPFPVFTSGTTQLVLPTTDIYFPCFVVNGTWGATQPTPVVSGGVSGAANTADGTHPIPNFQWAGQTDLPAVGASVTMNSTSVSYWLALY